MDFMVPHAESGLSIVLPAYNEADNLETLVSQCLEIVPQVTSLPFEVVAVNDGSTDQTGPKLDHLAARHPAVKVVHHLENLGCGQALLTGFQHTRYQHIFYMDSDLQFDLQELRLFMPYLNSHDLILGYRIARQDPWHRKLYSYSWNKLMYLLFGLNVKDINCGFRLFSREAIAPMQIESMGAMFFAEFLIKAMAAGVEYIEIGVNHYPRGSGQPTGGQLGVVVRAFREMYGFFWLWHFGNGKLLKTHQQA